MAWNKRSFAESADLIRDVVQPNDIGNIPYIGLEHVSQGQLSLMGFGYSDEVVSAKFRFRKGDILFGKLRPYFRKVIIAPFDGVCSTDIWVIRAKPGVDQRFLFYWMASTEFVDAATRASEGTKMPRAKWEFVERIERFLPEEGEQRDIAEVLGSLDDKIALNRRMNQTLETLAQAIFKSWFIDFEPVRAKMEGSTPAGMDAEMAALFPDSMDGDVPNGWKISSIGKEVKVVGGSTPSTQEPSFWIDGQHHWVTPKDLSSLQSPVLLDTERRITQAGVNQISSGLLPIGTVLLSSRAPVGYIAISEIPVAINQGFIAMICDGVLPNYYVWLWARENLGAIKSQANGTTFQEISKTSFRPIPVIVPSDKVLNSFVNTIAPLYQRMVSNLEEIKILAELRDLLLPKLLSGEVTVDNLENQSGL